MAGRFIYPVLLMNMFGRAHDTDTRDNDNKRWNVYLFVCVNYEYLLVKNYFGKSKRVCYVYAKAPNTTEEEEAET